MRKLVSASVFGLALAGSAIGFTGCSDTTGTTEQTKITTPTGTTTETRSNKVEKSGQIPPVAPSETKP
jgi:hypothetical protein